MEIVETRTAAAFTVLQNDAKRCNRLLFPQLLLTKWWQRRQQHGHFGSQPVQAFHRQVAERIYDRHWLRLRYIRIGGRIIAVDYGFHFQGDVGSDPRGDQLPPAASASPQPSRTPCYGSTNYLHA